MSFLRTINRILYSFSLVGFLDVLVLGTIIFFTIKFFSERKSIKLWKGINISFLAFYIFYLLFFAILCRTSGEDFYVNLIPLSSYYHYFLGENSEAIRTNTANLAVFYPLGLILWEMFAQRKHKLLKIALIAFTLSLAIELTQYILSIGYTEADDVLHNTLGAILGAKGYNWVGKRFNPYIYKKYKNEL